jgi:aerobic-type carbon monoxide dehydrogenase small subunit (CoxS/CutS family)
MPRIKLTADGRAVSVDVKHRTLLVHLLRDHPQSVSG